MSWTKSDLNRLFHCLQTTKMFKIQIRDNSNYIPPRQKRSCTLNRHNDISGASKQSTQLCSHTCVRERERKTHDSSRIRSFHYPNQIPARRWRHLRRYQPVPAGCVPRNRPEWAQFGHICRSCRDDETFPWIKCAVVNLHAIERERGRGSKEISWALSDLVVEWLVATQFWCIWRCLGSFRVNYIEL